MILSTIWRKLSLSELTPTQMILELADRSTTRPTGIAEDVFVRVGKFHFLANYVVVDYVVDPRVPLILGRPFLRTTRALNSDGYVEEITPCEEYSQEVLGFSDNSKSGNPTLISEPIIAKSLPSLTLFEGEDKELLKKVLKTHKQAIALKTSDIKNTMEIFKDDILWYLFGGSFSSASPYLDKILKSAKTPICSKLGQKCHINVKDGIVLTHKISKSRIEVDREKVDVIAKLPPPMSVKGIQSFLDSFIFSTECREASETFKKKLTEAPILVAPDWDLPFEIMCDASDFAVEAVLGQHLSDAMTWSHGVTLVNVKGIDFMGLFPYSRGNKYILVAVDYLSNLELKLKRSP
ncbi:reverse transcriptase domain-containing protein [Tanacetum coccineum]